MATEIVPYEQYAIAKVDDIQSIVDVVKDNLGGEQISESSLDTVKMPSGGSTSWTIPTLKGDVDSKTLDGVIVFSKLVRAYWQTSYDEGGGNDLPDCASKDSKQAFPVNAEFTPPATTFPEGAGFACSTCELAQFGSAPDGRGQACQQRRQLFMLTKDDVLPIVVSLSPTSLKAASDYMLRLTRGGVPYWRVVTSITLEKHTDPKPHARAIFAAASELDAEQGNAIRSYRDALVPAFSNAEATVGASAA